MKSTTIERGNLRGAQRGSRQDATANAGAVRLDLRRYMTAGRQADSAAKIGARERRGSMAIITGIQKSTTGGPTKEGETGRSRSGIPDDSRKYQGSVGEDITVVPEGQGQ